MSHSADPCPYFFYPPPIFRTEGASGRAVLSGGKREREEAPALAAAETMEELVLIAQTAMKEAEVPGAALLPAAPRATPRCTEMAVVQVDAVRAACSADEVSPEPERAAGDGDSASAGEGGEDAAKGTAKATSALPLPAPVSVELSQLGGNEQGPADKAPTPVPSERRGRSAGKR
jgi:hypothetical protein